ncbi:sensor histidine kinase, partial [Streptomyces lushanensis]|uniref:sensor histidine kinase n=1 Tax=Streptomyces lushanensis TaxID=1434255 RepID=UPI000AE259AB
SRRRLMEALRDQVEQLRVERELRAEQARSAERARIAREMHDVLAHRLSLLMLHTGVLQVQAETLPPAAVARIALLRGTAGQALDDLREVLGALRSDEPDEPGEATRTGETTGRTPEVMDTATGGVGTEVAAEGTPGNTLRCAPDRTPSPAGRKATVPAPALQDLAELLAEARAAGQRIESEISGDVASASTSHRLAVHRLVREALTNARKHAHATPVGVRVHYGWPATTVEVVNGPAIGAEDAMNSANTVSGPAGGYGLIGLAERVSALGGHLYSGATGGGWRLSARLPVPAADLSRASLT